MGLRPVLIASRPEDPDQEIIYGDGRSFRIRAGTAVVEEINNVIYLAIPLHNVGSGLAVLQRYFITAENPLHDSYRPLDRGLHDRRRRGHAPIEQFRAQQRDLYIASGDIGYWQAALRDPTDQLQGDVRRAVGADPEPISVDLLYGDHEGGQSTISRFNLVPSGDGEWSSSVVFHWILEGSDPRDLE